MPKIDSVSYGEIVVGGKTYYSDIVLWWSGRTALLEKTHLLFPSILKKILREGTEAVVIGVGIKGTVKIPASAEKALKNKKIRLFADKTENAVEIFNGLLAEGKKAVAIMHVTL